MKQNGNEDRDTTWNATLYKRALELYDESGGKVIDFEFARTEPDYMV